MAIGVGMWSVSLPGHFTNNKRVCGIPWVGKWKEQSFGLISLEKRKIHFAFSE
jgi:hypothetical protein